MTTIPVMHDPWRSDATSGLRDWRWALAAVMIVAVVVRFSNLGYNSLFHGEAARALDAWSTPWDRVRWFPPLQYVMIWCVRHGIGGSEFVLRFPSALAGCACVAALFLFLRKYVDAWSGVCAAAVCAVHPEMVAYSRILKEFSVEALMCIVVMWSGLAASRDPTRRRLLIFGLCGVLAFGLSYSAPLFVGAWVAVLGWMSLRSAAWTRPKVKHIAFLAAFFAVVFVLWYVWLSGSVASAGASTTYGKSEGAWPSAYTLSGMAQWFVVQSYGVLLYVLGTRPLYAPIDTLIGSFELLAAGAALATLWKRVPVLCMAAIVTFVLTVVAGALQLWPYGNYHMMLFLVPIVCIAIGCGLRQLASRLGAWSVPMLMLVLVCVINPAARAVKNTAVYPQVREHIRPTLRYVEKHIQPGDGLFAYYAAGWAVEYYWPGRWQGESHKEHAWRYNGVDVLVQPTSDRDDFKAFQARFDQFIASHGRVWFVFTHSWKSEREEWIGYLKAQYDILDEFETADASVHLVANTQHLHDTPRGRSGVTPRASGAAIAPENASYP